MINECVKLIATPFGSSGRVVKLTWELCECCNFTRIKLLRMKINRRVVDQPPQVFNDQHFSLAPNIGTNFAGPVYPFPPPAIANQVWTEFDELFDIAVGSDIDWYLGPKGPANVFGPFVISNQDGLILLAQCCETGVWMMSKVSVVRFLYFPWSVADQALIGYSNTDPPL
jgi:hypothetical protein